MSQIELRNICYDYGENGVHDISFLARPGEILAIVGPSGSGKSTLLKLISGFLQPSSGEILIADRLVADQKMNLEPQARSIGLVFQNHALLPHMNVTKNVAFALHDRKDPTKITKILTQLRIAHLARKYPHEISGGESQRVSLARSLAADSKILLMDEPFSSIDSVFRRELRHDLSRFLRSRDRTTIIVTHDAEEALELADQIVVLDHGRLLQQGSAAEIYHHPSHQLVAQLFGEINHIEDEQLLNQLGIVGKTDIFIRPESLQIKKTGGIEGRIIHIAYRGNHYMISLILEGQRCIKVSTTSPDFTLGQKLRISVNPEVLKLTPKGA